MIWGLYYGTVKNIAFVNVVGSGIGGDNGLLFWVFDAENVVENVYLKGHFPSENAVNIAGLSAHGDAFTYYNEQTHSWQTDQGEFLLQICKNANEIELEHMVIRVPQTKES
jgi:hypothetical protein